MALIAGQGFQAVQSLGQFGANNANAIAGLNTQSGQANAGSILNRQAIDNNLYSGLRQQVQQAVMGGAGGGSGFSLSSLFGGGSSPLSGIGINPSSLPTLNPASLPATSLPF
jgi:hypothetical protein